MSTEQFFTSTDSGLGPTNSQTTGGAFNSPENSGWHRFFLLTLNIRLKPKKGVTTVTTPLATCWLELHTLCIVTNDQERTPQKMRQHLEALQNITKSPYCCLVELKHSNDYTDDVKAIISGRVHDLCSALALIVKPEVKDASPAKFLKEHPNRKIPVKIFANERAARFWLGRKLLESKDIESSPLD